MPQISLATVQAAVSGADDRFADHNDGSFNVMDGMTQVPVMFNGSGNPTPAYYNYNIALMYYMDVANYNTLRDWWQHFHPTTGVILPPQFKHGSWIINLQWTTTHGRIFNMHIAVSGPG